jgi:hypothetical protein
VLDRSRDELGRNSDKAGLRRRNRKDAAMPELIGSSDNLWEYFKTDRAGRDHASDSVTAGPRAVTGRHRGFTLKPAFGAWQWHNLRLSSNRCSTCEQLRRLRARSEVAFRSARNLYRVAVKAADSAALVRGVPGRHNVGITLSAVVVGGAYTPRREEVFRVWVSWSR